VRWWFAWSLLAGCGRIGFGDVGDGGGDGGGSADGVPPDQIAIDVVSDGTPATAGQPIAAATVIVERGVTQDTLHTDAAGHAQFAAMGPTTIHVGYAAPGVSPYWRMYTLVDVPPGIGITVGGRTGAGSNHAMSFTLPVSAGAMTYGVLLPSRCGGGTSNSGTPTVVVSYPARCEGMMEGGLGLAVDGGGVGSTVDLGTVTMIDQSTPTFTGTYTVLADHTVNITNVPSSATAVDAYAADLLVTDRDTIARGLERSTTPSGSTASLVVPSMPADSLVVLAVGTQTPIATATGMLVPVVLPATYAFDAIQMLPLFENVTLAGDGRSASWTIQPAVGRPVADLLVYDAYYDVTVPTPILWTVLAQSATSVTFPTALSTTLAATPPSAAPSLAIAVMYDVPGVTGATSLLPTADRDYGLIAGSSAVFPVAGLAATLAANVALTPSMVPVWPRVLASQTPARP
jgi:hypothetical protein